MEITSTCVTQHHHALRETDVPAPRAVARPPLARFFLQEDLNFLLTNRIPRRQATLLMGWFSRVESRTLARLSIAVWRLFADDLRLEEAKQTDFRSLHECFTRELRPGARPIDPDPDVLVSPCDAVVGASGRVEGDRIYQAKGFPYTLRDLLGDGALADRHRDGLFVTLRLKANMYHRFHAPADAPRRACAVRVGGHLEREPDRAQARRTALLQERARRHRARLARSGRGPHARSRGLDPRREHQAPRPRPGPRPPLRRPARRAPRRRVRREGRRARVLPERIHHHRLRQRPLCLHAPRSGGRDRARGPSSPSTPSGLTISRHHEVPDEPFDIGSHTSVPRRAPRAALGRPPLLPSEPHQPGLSPRRARAAF